MRTIYLSIALVVLLLTVPGFVPTPPASVRVSVQPGSRLWIEGSSTVSAWTCEAGEIEGQGLINPDPEGPGGSGAHVGSVRPRVRLTAQASSFKCGSDRMNRDFIDALEADRHPEIVYDMLDARVMDALPTQDGWYRINVRGNLSIAGTTREIEAIAWGRRQGDGRYRVRGSKPLKMTSFGVKPPVALFGLVKAHDDIEVHFDLLAAADSIAGREAKR